MRWDGDESQDHLCDIMHGHPNAFKTLARCLAQAQMHGGQSDAGVPDPSQSHLFAKAYAACEATDRFCHAYCTAITLHSACQCLTCILYSYHTSFCMPVFPARHTLSGPSSTPRRVSPRGASASAVSASIVCAPSCSTWCVTTSSLKAGAGRNSVWHAR